MADPSRSPSFATLLQRFFAEHLTKHRSVSPCTIAAYRDTFRLLLLFAERRIGKPPTTVALADLDAPLVLAFLDHLEAERGNSARTRNVRLTSHPLFPWLRRPPRPLSAADHPADFGHSREAFRPAHARLLIAGRHACRSQCYGHAELGRPAGPRFADNAVQHRRSRL